MAEERESMLQCSVRLLGSLWVSCNVLQGPKHGMHCLAQGAQNHTWSQAGVSPTRLGKRNSARKGNRGNRFQGNNTYPVIRETLSAQDPHHVAQPTLGMPPHLPAKAIHETLS